MALTRDISRGEQYWDDGTWEYRRLYFTCPLNSLMTDKPTEGTVLPGDTAVTGFTVMPGGVQVVEDKKSASATVIVTYSKWLTRTWS